ncbi:MAG: hypothetical protein ABSD92_05790 [Candidatus Bathyarchaeia archaeon]
MPTMAIAMIMAITEATMYVMRSDAVAAFVTGVTAGAGVAGGEPTKRCVSAQDP